MALLPVFGKVPHSVMDASGDVSCNLCEFERVAQLFARKGEYGISLREQDVSPCGITCPAFAGFMVVVAIVFDDNHGMWPTHIAFEVLASCNTPFLGIEFDAGIKLGLR